MKTITSQIIRPVMQHGFDINVLLSDEERRKHYAGISIDELDELITRLTTLRGYVVDMQHKRRQEALNALTAAVGESTVFESIAELLAAVTISNAVEPLRIKSTVKCTKSTKSNNKTFQLEIVDEETGETVTGTSINKQLSAEIRNSEVYKRVLAHDPEMENVDILLRKYSAEYQEAYPFNARWKGQDFYMNTQGKPNGIAAKYYEEFKQKDHSGLDGRKLLVQFKKVVYSAYPD